MEVIGSLLEEEILTIINQVNNTSEVTVTGLLHTINEDIVLDNIVNLDVLTDYNNNYSDQINIEFLVPLGDLVKYIYPFRNNLEISIIMERGVTTIPNRYKFVGDIDSSYSKGKYKTTDYRKLNEQEQVRITGQCIDFSIVKLRITDIPNAIYHDTTIEEVLRYQLTTALNGEELTSPKGLIGVDIKPIDNQRVYTHIIIPPGKNVLDIPSYFQNSNYGLYNGALGVYYNKTREKTYFYRCDLYGGECIEKEVFYVFPLYDTTRVDSYQHRLEIYSVEDAKYDMMDNTYYVDGDILKIVGGSKTKKNDTGDNTFMDIGTGFKMINDNIVIGEPITVTEDKVISSYDTQIRESYHKDRSDGSMYRSTIEATDNLYKPRSDYIKDDGYIIQIQWRNSNTKYLLPGMAVTYMHLSGEDNVVISKGILQSHYTVYNVVNKEAVSILNIFMEKDKEVSD